ncbi:hypothetical protein A9R05_21290 [Burkholderia sp. KK1]|nr:hypothetical protein A9R05_21290 [Burkholderia sp. KK1]
MTADHRTQQGLDEAKRDAVKCRLLVSVEEMTVRLHRSRTHIEEMLRTGELFSLDVDGKGYIPVLLDADPSIRQHLWDVCAVIQPAPVESRLAYLTSGMESSSGPAPLDFLKNDFQFGYLMHHAKRWAAKWSRTEVLVLDGTCEAIDADSELLYSAMLEVDPREALWLRAAVATDIGRRLQGKRPVVGRATLFVGRITPPRDKTLEARLVLTIADRGMSVCVEADDMPHYLVPMPRCIDLNNPAHLAKYICGHMANGGRDAGISVEGAAIVLSAGEEEVEQLLADGSLLLVANPKKRRRAVSLDSLRSYRVAAQVRAMHDVARLKWLT